MPVRIDEIDTDQGMVFEPLPPLATASRAVFLPEVGLTLRKLNDDETNFQPDGRYKQTTVILAPWVAEGLTGLFGFETTQGIDPEVDNQDPSTMADIDYQLSIDGGTTWLYWDPVAAQWLPAVGINVNRFNDVLTIDQNIPKLPFGFPRGMRLKARLKPGLNGLQRPFLRTTYIFNSHVMDLFEDVTRSMKRYIDANFQVRMTFNVLLQAPKPTMVIDTTAPGLNVKIDPASVVAYNLDKDPGRNTNLVSAFDPVKNLITFTTPQTGNIGAEFIGIPDVFIGGEDFLQVSKIPSVVVIVNRIEQYLQIRARVDETERSISRGVGRLQYHRLYYRIYATVRVQSALKREALQMTEDICRILDQGDKFDSVANGDHYCVMEQTNELQEDRVPQGLFVSAVNLKLLGKAWLKGDDTVAANLPVDENGLIPLVQTVNTFVGSDDLSTLNLPDYLRRVYREQTVTDESTPGG